MDTVSLYRKWLDPVLFQKFYSSLNYKHVSMLAPFVYDLLHALRQQCSGMEGIISSRTLSNTVAKHFESFWADKLVKLFSVELSYLEQHIHSTTSIQTKLIQGLNDIDYRLSFVERYPVLMSFVETYCENYKNFLFELIQNIHHDYEDISAQFTNNNAFHVTRIDLAGDAHQSGKHTVILTYKDSQGKNGKLVYKPGRAANSKAFYLITQKIFALQNDNYKTPEILSTDKGYYSEYIDHSPCDDLQAVQLYYERVGKLIAIVQLVKGHDIHFENIIAHGSYPVLIDCECLFTPQFQFDKNNPDTAFICTSLVNAIGFIPTLHEKSDISALTGPYIFQQEKAFIPEIFQIFEPKAADPVQNDTPNSHNKPFCEGYEIDARDYVQDILSGYKTSYDLISTRAEYLFNFITETLQEFAVETRIVLKPTEYYSKFINEMFYPKHLKSREALEEYLHLLVDSTENRSIYASELQQLLNLDVPIFNLPGFESTLVDGLNNTIPMYCYQSFSDVLDYCFKYDINKENYQSNVNLIQHGFGLREINLQSRKLKNHPHSFYSVQQAMQASLTNTSTEKLCDRLLNVAKLLLDASQELAIYNQNQVYWPAAGSVKLKDNKFIYYPKPGDDTLYDGSMGVLLTQYYGYKVFNDEKYRLFVIRLVNSITEYFAKKTKLLAGAYTGIGQYLYVLSIIEADFSQEIKPLKDLVFNRLHTEFEQILLEDKNYDVVIGVAGFAVSLVRAHHVFPEEIPVSYLKQCAEYLCRNFNVQLNFFLGMSHGLAGIAWAMHQLQPYIHSNFPTEFIQNLLRIERSYFDIEQANWPLFNEEHALFHSDNNFTTYWCHGSIGIILSRMDLYCNGYRDEVLPYEVSLGVHCMKQYPMLKQINLCHGNLAWFDILLQAKKCGFKIDKDFDVACQFLLKELQKPDCAINHLGNLFDVSLMTGHNGLAYQIMRITHPDIVPSILLLEH